MADTKISGMPAATALTGAELVAGVQSAANVKITASQIKTLVTASPSLPSLLASSGAPLSVGATTAETVLVTIPLAANALGANGFIIVDTTWATTNGLDDKTLRTRFGASGAGTGGTAFKSIVVTAAATFHDGVVIQNKNATNAQEGASAGGLATNFGAATGPAPTSAIDTTAACEVVLSGQKETSGDTLTLLSYRIWIVKN